MVHQILARQIVKQSAKRAIKRAVSIQSSRGRTEISVDLGPFGTVSRRVDPRLDSFQDLPL